MGNRTIISTLLEKECVAELLNENAIEGYVFSLQCIQASKHKLICKKDEKTIANYFLFTSISTDKYSKKEPNPVFRTIVIEQIFNNIRTVVDKKYTDKINNLEKKILSTCSASIYK